MSVSSLINDLLFIVRQINIHAGLFLFICGILGNLLSILVFLSLRTFRESLCSFYLTIMSFVNIGQLLTGLLSRATFNLSNIDWTQISWIYCKIHMYFLVVCTNISMLCMCLATIDQYLATCHRPYWQRLSDLKYARVLSRISIIFSVTSAIPYLIYYIHYLSVVTGKIQCTTTDAFFDRLNVYFYRLIMSNILPLLIILIFGLLTYRNIQQIAYRTVPLVRRELDKPLTSMILVQDVFTFFIFLPITTMTFISLNPQITRDPLVNAEYQLANNIAVMFHYSYFAVSELILVNVKRLILFRHRFIFISVFLNDFVDS